jgi:hypothetical protein
MNDYQEWWCRVTEFFKSIISDDRGSEPNG